MHIVAKEPFDPKKHPAVAQADQSIRAFGIEFHSRYGVLAEYRMMITAVETWMPRGLFWHIEKIFFDSKSGSMMVTLKERDCDLAERAQQIAHILKLHLGDACASVFVEDHLEQIIAEGRGA
ncbi:hypothetical protein [Sphingomonas sp.]|uniref:hypothetical protein n=1 Tax=Sphingomonas sp. TaxID=28214 RepID=UPI00185F2659|nr:hypothetical protein [Sphingomonas sp.]MBA3511843.1 hypothetical protein [Sphingomonas sp.]